MKNIKNRFNINPATYFLIITFLITGLIKNIILIYLIVIVHELGHVFIIKLLKYKIIKVEIYPMGGVTLIDKNINTKLRDEFLISSFGLVFQVLLGLVFFLLKNLGLIYESTYLMFFLYNKTIFIFNLLPIIPLDGYIFFRSIWEFLFPYKKAFHISFFVSIVFIILFITYNQIFSLNNYLIISFLIFKIFLEAKNFKLLYFRFLLERHLNNFFYRDIKYERKIDLDLLKKDTFHYFKIDNQVLSEKELLARKFKN